MTEAIGYDVEFIEKPDSLLHTNCGICHLVLCNPCETTCCGVYYCRACIEQYKKYKKTCPNCRRNLGWHASQAQTRLLNQLKVFCEHKAKGCKWEGELGQLKTHLNKNNIENLDTDCQFAPLICPRCEEDVQRVDYNTHQTKDCPERDVECPNHEKGCIWKGPEYDINQHLNLHSTPKRFEGCNFAELSCHFKCGQSVERRELKSHESTCSYRLVDCDFKGSGCSAKVPQRDMQTHLCVDHVKMLFETCTNLEKVSESHAKQIRALEQQNQATKDNLTRRLQTLEQENTKCKTDRQALRSIVRKKAKVTKWQNFALLFAAIIIAFLLGILLEQSGSRRDEWTVKPLILPAILAISNVTSYNESEPWISPPLTWPDRGFVFHIEAYAADQNEENTANQMEESVYCIRFRTSSEQEHYLLKANITIQIMSHQSFSQHTIRTDFDKWAPTQELVTNRSCFKLPESEYTQTQLYIRVLQFEINKIKCPPDIFAICDWYQNEAGNKLSSLTTSHGTFTFELSNVFSPQVTLTVEKKLGKDSKGNLRLFFYGAYSGTLNHTVNMIDSKASLTLPSSEFKDYVSCEFCLAFQLTFIEAIEDFSSLGTIVIFVIIFCVCGMCSKK